MKSIIQLIKHGIDRYGTWVIFAALAGLFQHESMAQAGNYFRNPLDIPIKLSSNFGEIRPDHFHTGFDIRTNEKTGYSVYSAANGYVSRIKVSGTGYGNVLYITHPNGYMTVYGHLDRFNDTIARFVKKQQYIKESFEIELFPEANKFPVKKGDLVAYSGNSGGSGGPHLHFEIRDASGETYPVNPASFFKLADTLPPKFSALYLYSINKTISKPRRFQVGVADSCNIYSADSIIVNSKTIGIAADVRDYMNATTNDYGIYEFSVTIDLQPIYSLQFDRLDFSNGRYANAFIDFAIKKESGITVQRFFRLPGDHNPIYRDLVNDGKISFNDTAYHQVVITAKDAYGNSSELMFFAKYSGNNKNEIPDTTVSEIFRYNESNSFSADSIRLSLPSNILYEDLDFQYSISGTNDLKINSALHHVHDALTPLHSYYNISLLPRLIADSLKPKAVIVYFNSKGNRSSKTSHWEGKWLLARAREFGDFAIMLDTVAPKISPVGMKQDQLLRTNTLKFLITDNLSGIVSYRGLLDGKWILMEYDPKNNRLSCELDKDLSQGSHSLKIILTDDVKNQNSYTFKFKK